MKRKKQYFAPTMGAVQEVERMRKVLAPIVQQHFGNAWQLRQLTIEVPKKRLMRYKIEAYHPAENRTLKWRLIGKVYSPTNLMQKGVEIIQQLWDEGFNRDSQDGISIPEHVAYLPDLSLLLMEEIMGRPLRQMINDGTASQQDMDSFARATVKLHQSSVRPERTYSVHDQLESCKPRPDQFCQELPEFAANVQEIIETARACQDQLPQDVRKPIHGDYHPGQVHIDNGRVWILDLDKIKFADPAHDIAEVVLFLKRKERKARRADYIHALRDTFFQTYFDRMGWDIAGRIPLYEALIHLKRACKLYRMQNGENWRDEMQMLIQQGHTCISVLKQSPREMNLDRAIQAYEACPGWV